ncbi:MAG: PAS domain-containing sensor histidine kinase [Halapricum sp.]
MGPESSETLLSALFVDPDGRLAPIAYVLEDLDRPVETYLVETVSMAVDAVEAEPIDLVVVLDAPPLNEADEGVDGVENYLDATERLQVPVAIYSVDCDHACLQRAIDAGAPVVSTTPDRGGLIYRQLRNAAGMEEYFQSDPALLESLLEYYPHHIFLKDDAGRFEAMSTATAREYGFRREELVGLTDYEVLDPLTARETYEEEQALMDSGEPTVNRIDHWVDDRGRPRWMSITKAPRYDEDGNPIGVVGSSRDVTEEKRQEQMVRELHEASRELVRAESKADIGQAATDLTADIPVFSHIQVALQEDGGLEPVTDGNGNRDGSLYTRYECAYADAFETGESQQISTENHPEAGSPDDLQAVVLPLGEHGALGLAADADVFTDFGIDLAHILASNVEAALDRAERERELERQNERLEEFASIVSHDLRNPLNVASASTELVAEEIDSDNVARIKNALERMDRLIEALLTLARKGKVVGETEFVSIGAAAKDAWQVVDAPEATLAVESSGVVAADRNRLVEVFENLFRNTVDHGPPNVSVRVGIREDGDGFYVCDDGPGIEPAIRDQIFEMGFSEDTDGTGYGLYIVSTIVEAHGWSIDAGTADTGGARFDVTGAVVESLEDQ